MLHLLQTCHLPNAEPSYSGPQSILRVRQSRLASSLAPWTDVDRGSLFRPRPQMHLSNRRFSSKKTTKFLQSLRCYLARGQGGWSVLPELMETLEFSGLHRPGWLREETPAPPIKSGPGQDPVGDSSTPIISLVSSLCPALQCTPRIRQMRINAKAGRPRGVRKPSQAEWGFDHEPAAKTSEVGVTRE
jgi:hypothetical protein